MPSQVATHRLGCTTCKCEMAATNGQLSQGVRTIWDAKHQGHEVIEDDKEEESSGRL